MSNFFRLPLLAVAIAGLTILKSQWPRPQRLLLQLLVTHNRLFNRI